MNKKEQDLARLKELAKNKDKLTDEEKKEFGALVSKYKFKGNKRDKKDHKPGTNDLSWWNRYPELTESVTNLPFNYIPGTPRGITNEVGSTLNAALSGLMRVEYIPTIGDSQNASSGFNAQMRQLWLDMHRKFRGIGTYQRADLGITIYCILNVFTTLAKFERIYGTINTYKVANRNVPRLIKEALGISTNLEANLSEFRYQLNLRISKLQQLCLPKGMSIFDAEVILNSFIFKDSENKRASLFLYDPSVFYVYDATRLSTGGSAIGYRFIDFMNLTTPGSLAGAFSVADVLSILDMQINALISDDDVARICSDMIACYGSDNLQTVGYVPEDYKIEPIFDYERQLQLHNAVALGEYPSEWIRPASDGVTVTEYGAIRTATNCNIFIWQHDDVILNKLYVGNDTPAYTSSSNTVYTCPHNAGAMKTRDMFFDTWKENPDVADVMCGSRFSALGGNMFTYSSKNFQILDAYGTEIVVKFDIFYQAGTTLYQTAMSNYAAIGDYSESDYSQLNQFDWHPIIYVENAPDMAVFGDLDNFTTMNAENLSRIHDVAIYSAFKLDLPLSNTIN